MQAMREEADLGGAMVTKGQEGDGAGQHSLQAAEGRWQHGQAQRGQHQAATVHHSCCSSGRHAGLPRKVYLQRRTMIRSRVQMVLIAHARTWMSIRLPMHNDEKFVQSAAWHSSSSCLKNAQGRLSDHCQANNHHMTGGAKNGRRGLAIVNVLQKVWTCIMTTRPHARVMCVST